MISLKEDVDMIKGQVVDNTANIKSINKKLDLLMNKMDNLTDTFNQKQQNVGTIQKGDWKGTIAEIVTALILFLSMGFGIYTVLGFTHEFWNILYINTLPIVYILLKGLTGKNIKDLNLVHSFQEKLLEDKHKKEIDSLKNILSQKDGELWIKKAEIARLEGKKEALEKLSPPPPITP